MGSGSDLEKYLRTAPVMYERPLVGGGGHRDKKILWLEGGVAVAAKAGSTPELMTQARCEVAAWLLALELEMTKLVPTTVMRKMPAAAGGEVECSAQVMWTQFKMALGGGFTHTDCPDETGWHIAVFDVLAANIDRHDGNWGAIDAMPDAVLVDHGHCFTKSPNTTSQFYVARQGQQIPDGALALVQKFVDDSDRTRLKEVLDQPIVQQVIDRAQHLVHGGVLALP